MRIEYSVYGLGDFDAEQKPSKVTKEVFDSVCSESASHKLIDPKQWGYKHLISAAQLDEPSICLGEKLREHFRPLLQETGVKIHYNANVHSLKHEEDGRITINTDNNESFAADHVINASGYQNLLPKDIDFPLDLQVGYQPCLAMVYKDKYPQSRPFSFIVMDGWFPCIMPYVTEEEGKENEYILTHGKWTIMGSYDNANEAHSILNSLSNEYINEEIKPRCEEEINRFWPQFAERFEFVGWKGSVLAKLNTKSEFRSAITYAEGNVTHIIPGKVTNIFDADKETIQLLNNSNIINDGRFKYVKNGVLDQSIKEIKEKSTRDDRSTYSLKTFKELSHNPKSNSSLKLLWKAKPEQEKETFNPDLTSKI